VLLANFGAAPVAFDRLPVPARAKLLLSSDGAGPEATLAPWQALVLGTDA
jgi:hypothetical protein